MVNDAVENVLAMLDGFRMSDEMTYSAYSALYDEISLLDDLLKEQEPKPVLSQRECEVLPNHYERKGYCPKCHQTVEWFLNRSHCGFCGQAVKWDE